MTTFLVITAVLLVLGCVFAKGTTSSIIAKSRRELAEISAEGMKMAALRNLLEAQLGVLHDKERREIRVVKKLKAQLSEVQAQIDGSQSE